jgi:hypothetical protein
VIVREPGIGGECPVCGELLPSEARYCAHCGHPLTADAHAERARAVAAEAAAEAAAQAEAGTGAREGAAAAEEPAPPDAPTRVDGPGGERYATPAEPRP